MSANQKARLLRVLPSAAAAVLLLGSYVASATRGGWGIPCPLLLLTGWQCPACGMTRAAAALAGLDLPAAFACNALWPLYAVYLLWVVLSDACHYVRSGALRLLPRPTWLHAAFLAAILAYGLLRNLL